MLRRNVGRGKTLEGLEVRWGLVARILQALTQFGIWRSDGSEGPMHKYYDRRLFDMLSEDEVLAEYAPQGVGGLEMVSWRLASTSGI